MRFDIMWVHCWQCIFNYHSHWVSKIITIDFNTILRRDRYNIEVWGTIPKSTYNLCNCFKLVLVLLNVFFFVLLLLYISWWLQLLVFLLSMLFAVVYEHFSQPKIDFFSLQFIFRTFSGYFWCCVHRLVAVSGTVKKILLKLHRFLFRCSPYVWVFDYGISREQNAAEFVCLYFFAFSYEFYPRLPFSLTVATHKQK